MHWRYYYLALNHQNVIYEKDKKPLSDHTVINYWAEFSQKILKTYLHLLSFINTEMVQVNEIVMENKHRFILSSQYHGCCYSCQTSIHSIMFSQLLSEVPLLQVKRVIFQQEWLCKIIPQCNLVYILPQLYPCLSVVMNSNGVVGCSSCLICSPDTCRDNI